MPLFGASNMIHSGPGWTNYSTRRSFDKNVNHISCAAFLKLVSFQAHSQHHKGSIYHCCGCLGDMWRARVLFWGAPLPDEDQLRVFCLQVTVGSFLSQWSTLIRPCHTREGDNNFNSQSFVLGSIFCLLGTLSPRRQAPPALYRSSAGFLPICGVAARADFSDDELERHRACPSIKTSANEPSDAP